jgi:Ca2+-binding RTX toxin-like protein
VAGGSGNDTIYASAGWDDTISGGHGNDVIKGGTNSTVSGNDGNDTISVSAKNDSVEIDGNGAFKTIGQSAFVYGGRGDDVMYSQADSTIDGGGTASTANVFGGAGDDRIAVSGGANVVDGGDGFDTVSFAKLSEGLTFTAGTTLTDGPAAGTRLANVEQIYGTSFDDHLTGASGLWISGGMGDDTVAASATDTGPETLEGGAGHNLLVGSAGTRGPITFLLDGGADTIEGFSRANGDKLALDNATFRLGLQANLNLYEGAVVSETGTHAATADANNGGRLLQLIYQQDTGQIWLDLDGVDTVYAPMLIATLDPAKNSIGSALQQDDFTVIYTPDHDMGTWPTRA